jgi:23S rRNA pseudouridine1911/1915/1917 synthase
VRKTYLAVVAWDDKNGGPARDAELTHWLEPSGNGGMRVAPGKRGGAKEARLAYRRVGVSPDGRRALLEVDLLTGVKHQIRCQLASMGCPVAGDFRYGPGGGPARPEPVLGGRAILLHAWRLGFMHPVRREPVEITAGVPGYWMGYINTLDGAHAETYAV